MMKLPSSQGTKKIHALYGYPIEHSLSPIMFNAAFKQQGLNREYLAFSVAPDRLSRAVDAARTLGFQGFNVTMPLKELVVPLLDRIEGNAEDAGAVNTVASRPSGLVGYNTDGEGIVRSLESHGFHPDDCSVVILGAGGAAKGAVGVLSKTASRITILNRTIDRARKIADRTKAKAQIDYEELSRESLLRMVGKYDLILNTTPLDTVKVLEIFRIPINTIPDRTQVFDLAYDRNEGNGKFSKNNRFRGPSPLELLFQQATLSYRIWMDTNPPFEAMRNSLVDCVGYDWRDLR